MSDIPLSSIVGDAGWKADSVTTVTNLNGSSAGVIYTLNPTAGKVVRLTYLAIPGSSGGATGITVKFGGRTVLSRTIGSIFNTSSAPSIIGQGPISISPYLEGLEGEIMTIESSIAVVADLNILAVIGSYR